MATQKQALEYLDRVYIISDTAGDAKLDAKLALVESLRMYEHLVGRKKDALNIPVLRLFARKTYIETLLKAGADPDDVITKLALLLG